MSLLKLAFVFGVLAVSLSSVQSPQITSSREIASDTVFNFIRISPAVSSEEKQKFEDDTSALIGDCRGKYGVSLEDVKKAKQSNSYGNLDPCFIACVYKKSDLIDDQGLFDAEKSKVFIKKYLSEEADEKKAFEIIANCKSVNEQKVSDGVKGCERSALLFECFGPLKAMFVN